ncbi:MAG: hypothetical protein ABI548_06440 [Polyangiaceae bacterium]
MPIDAPVRISQMLAARIFDTVSTRQNPQNRRINIAIEWHAAAMANPSAVTLQQRLIGLKTGFEALVGKSKSRECATKLRGLFHDTTLAHHGLFPWAGCIWSPTERTDLSRTYRENGTTKTVLKSELEDWFTALADARNAIIHDGRMPFDSYSAPPERPLSRYAGHLFWKGERILREAIKCTLGADILLCGLLAKQKRMEEFIALIQDSLSDEVAPTPPSPPTQSDRHVESRALEVLLAELECDTANKVQVTKGFRERRNNDDEPAEEFWIAGFASIETTVTPDEKKVLKEAGAEDKLPEFFEACD